jgi:PAS domain S-box-containing protein
MDHMLENLLLAINDCAWAYDLNKNKYVFISPASTNILGISAADMMADKELWNKIIIPEDRKVIISITKKIKKDTQAELYYRIKLNDQIKWIFEKKVYFFDKATGHNMMLGVIKDISDQRTVNYHLQNSLGDFSVLFNKSLSPMWIYEIPSLRILKVNEAAIENYGYTEKEFLALTIRDIRPKIDLAKFNEYIFKKGITKGTLHGYNNSGIWKHLNKNSEVMYAEITGYDIKYNNTSARVVVATNITERVLREKDLIRREALLNQQFTDSDQTS